MNSDSINYIDTTPTLHNFLTEARIINKIVEELLKLPDVKSLKLSMDLLLHIALMIENLCYENNVVGRPKGYKVDICLKVFEKMGFITREEDKAFVTNGLNFLHAAGKIKRISFCKRLFARIYHFLVNLK